MFRHPLPRLPGCPDVKGFRPLCWKLLLFYLPNKRSMWESELSKQRAAYVSFIEEMIIKPGSQSKEGSLMADHVSNSKICEVYQK